MWPFSLHRWPSLEDFHPLKNLSDLLPHSKGRQATVYGKRRAQRETVRSLHQSESPARLIPTGRATLSLRRKMQLSVDLIALSWRLRTCWVIEEIVMDEQREGLTSHFTPRLLCQDGGGGGSEEECDIRETESICVWMQSNLIYYVVLCQSCVSNPSVTPEQSDLWLLSGFFCCSEKCYWRWRYQPHVL